MIKAVEIIINNGPINIVNSIISFEDNICLYNNHKYIIDEDFKDELVKIISLWKHEYGYSNNIDDQEFNVTVYTDKKESFHGKGIFPNNYASLIGLFEGLDNGR